MTRFIEGLTLERLMSLITLFSVAALLLAACAQLTPPLEEDLPEEPSLQLVLDQSTVEILRGAYVQVEVTVTRVGDATQPASLRIDGVLPDGVSAEFDPLEITGSSGTSNLTLSAAADAEETVLELTVVAESDALSASEGLNATVASLTVVGRVEDVFGQALTGGRAASQGQVVFIEADGTFRLSGLSVPYDLMIGSGSAERLHAFEGLSDPAPVVVPYGAFFEPDGEGKARIAGTVLGGDKLGTDERVIVCVEGHVVVVYLCGQAFAGETEYELEATWYGEPGSSSQPATIHAIHYLEGANDETADFLGYDSLEVELDAAASITWNLEFEPVGTEYVKGEVVRGAGIGSGSLITMAAVRFGDTLSMVVSGAADEPEMSLLVPQLPSAQGAATYDLHVLDGFTGPDMVYAWRSGIGVDAGEISLGDLPALTGPDGGVMGMSHATPFGVEGLEGEVKTFVWAPDAGDPGPNIALTTTRDEVTIPDPALLNIGGMIRGGQGLRWGVNSSMADDVDEATTEFRRLGGAVMTYLNLGGAPEGAGDYLSPGGREFVFGLPP